jgi:AcrR family transcriptional regulator
MDDMPEESSRAHELLMKVIAYIRGEGRVDLSLRQLAAGAGTSHRMLGYYFGTREQLLGLVMRQLSIEYIAHFSGRRPTTRVEAIRGTWERFRDPNNRLQTQLLFTLASAAAENPELEVPALTSDLDNFSAALTHFGVTEGLPADRARREARLIVATLLGLYLDYFVTRGSSQVDESYEALVEWVERSSAN